MADIKYIITVDSKGATRNIKEFDGSLKETANTASTKTTPAIGGMWKQIAGGIIVIAALRKAISGASGLIKSIFEVGIETENYKVRLEALLGSQEAATDAMQYFKDVASKVPFTLQGVIKAGTQLTAFGLDMKEWTPALTDLASVMGMDLPEAASALGRAYAGGAGAADIFRERGILNIIKDSARMKDGITDITKLTLPQFRKVMLETFTDPGGRIFGAADKLAKTWSGTVSMIQDKFYQTKEAIAKAGIFDLVKEKLVAFNDKLQEWIDSGKMEEFARQISKALENIVELIDKKVLPAISKLMQGVVDWTYILRAKLQEAPSYVKGLIEGLEKARKKLVEMGLSTEDVDAQIDHLKIQLHGHDVVLGEVEKTTKKVTGATDAFGKDIVKISEKITNTALPAFRDILGIFEKLDQSIYNMSVPAFNALINTLKPGATGAAGAAGKAVGELTLKLEDMPGAVRLAMQEVSTVVSDAMRNIARSIANVFDFKKLFGAMAKNVKFDSTMFDDMVDAAREAYDEITEAARGAFHDQELLISRAEEDEDIRLRSDYERRRDKIKNSNRTEEEKVAMLEKIEIKYEADKLARERRREDEKYLREQEQKKKLLALEKEHQLDLDGIRREEDAARDRQAQAEIDRQSTLWFKVKGIFATAAEEMATLWLTKLLTPITDSITSKIFPAFDDLAKKGSETGGAMGDGMAAGAEKASTAWLGAIGMIVGAFSAFKGLLDWLDKKFDLRMPTAEEQKAQDEAYTKYWTDYYAKKGMTYIVVPTTGRKRTGEETEVTAAQHGFDGVVKGPRMFYVEPGIQERVTITPNINPSFNFGNSKTTINIDGRAVAIAIAPYVPELSRMGVMKFHKNGLVEH